MVISRIGSLVLEPLFKRLRVVKYVEYAAYVAALQTDAKLDELSETNNVYRTVCSLFLTLGGLMLYGLISNLCPIVRGWTPGALIGVLFLLFALSYRKQTRYIVDRVNARTR
jgi:hypothetical protein